MRKSHIEFAFSAGVHLALLAGILFVMAAPPPHASTREVAVEVDVVPPPEAERQPPEPKVEERKEEGATSADATPATPQQAAAQAAEPPPAASASAAQSAPSEPPQAPRGGNRFDQVAAQLRYETHLGATDFDAKATQQAVLTDDQIAAFKARLKSCWKPEAGIAAGSRTHVVLRVTLNVDGSLAAEPTLVEAGAAADGPAVMRTAIKAVTGCAPFALPRERYSEWRVMDIRFSSLEMGG